MKKLKRILIMAGGTGGHVFPGLAVAEELRKNQLEVHWLGTARGLEAKLVPEAGINLHLISVTGLRGKGAGSLLKAPFQLLRALWQSLRVMQKIKPDVVIGMGGFASGPGGIASWLSGRTLIIHEQNAIAGLTNKILSYFSKRVLAGFPTAFRPATKVNFIGNPVRQEIAALPAPVERFQSDRPFRLLVLGGSLGATALNKVVADALYQMPADVRPEVLHQTGDKHFEESKKHYESIGLSVNLKPFIKDMAGAYAWADFVICRAGALTVAELCAAGLGAILIPFPYAAGDHQTANAQFLVSHQAAFCVPQSGLTAASLAEMIQQLAQSPAKRHAMAMAAYQLRRTEAVNAVVKACQEVFL
ncbi:MAG TPA: undecaprenyldiphospho-muramoylpentapeptide beta-N-acetylglucosaminyltransferase [Gammaproteobacteria bacterium]|jgi:UDP-N-acetylglucosamine--N-acetylmuramyl-(pentapeptide) pyrophosphoryl-undecaprenol N-acetylglucosamine transferase|nr:undecaprenyldiphospho-muramoylpentapeptide beta-N-acetylglucosaminyltransferase [Gammaproteobacteria bacterium]